MLMVTMVRPIAMTGETSAMVADRSARFSSTNCIGHFLLRQTAAAHQQAVLHHAAGGVAGEQGVFRQPHPWRGAVAEALFRHEGGAEFSSRGNREMSGGLAVDHDGAGIFCETLARQRGE